MGGLWESRDGILQVGCSAHYSDSGNLRTDFTSAGRSGSTTAQALTRGSVEIPYKVGEYFQARVLLDAVASFRSITTDMRSPTPTHASHCLSVQQLRQQLGYLSQA